MVLAYLIAGKNVRLALGLAPHLCASAVNVVMELDDCRLIRSRDAHMVQDGCESLLQPASIARQVIFTDFLEVFGVQLGVSFDRFQSLSLIGRLAIPMRLVAFAVMSAGFFGMLGTPPPLILIDLVPIRLSVFALVFALLI